MLDKGIKGFVIFTHLHFPFSKSYSFRFDTFRLCFFNFFFFLLTVSPFVGLKRNLHLLTLSFSPLGQLICATKTSETELRISNRKIIMNISKHVGMYIQNTSKPYNML